MRTPVSDPLRVGSYRIVGRLGSGGMGWVYLARSPGGRAVAVKVVRPEYAADPEFRQRFAREVTAARAVGGAFTAAVVDADPEGDPPWLATVYVPGPALSEAVRAAGPFTEAQVRVLGAGLVEALQAIHAGRVVHRDLKPANVLLAADGPRVIDFGISLLSGAPKLTRPGITMGTLHYMSPEQLTTRPVGPPSDVFSLAGVLVYAATGHAPFGDATDVIYRVVEGSPELDGVPDGLRATLTRCFARQPEERPGLDVLLDEFLTGVGDAADWPPPAVSEAVRARVRDLAARAGPGAGPDRGLTPSVPSCLRLHAQALLDAGLTATMVKEAARRGAR
ncbi:serine/threonine protein kinase [Streptomyces sp. NBC_00414]|uniref:serine/threonine-protein kinase n=1 Tax=Streptomyces sp. NBC_00414 TaxID=2975739 RepID=UPI002E21262E